MLILCMKRVGVTRWVSLVGVVRLILLFPGRLRDDEGETCPCFVRLEALTRSGVTAGTLTYRTMQVKVLTCMDPGTK